MGPDGILTQNVAQRSDLLKNVKTFVSLFDPVAQGFRLIEIRVPSKKLILDTSLPAYFP